MDALFVIALEKGYLQRMIDWDWAKVVKDARKMKKETVNKMADYLRYVGFEVEVMPYEGKP